FIDHKLTRTICGSNLVSDTTSILIRGSSVSGTNSERPLDSDGQHRPLDLVLVVVHVTRLPGSVPLQDVGMAEKISAGDEESEMLRQAVVHRRVEGRLRLDINLIGLGESGRVGELARVVPLRAAEIHSEVGVQTPPVVVNADVGRLRDVVAEVGKRRPL